MARDRRKAESVEELRRQLSQAEETLPAIRCGDVDTPVAAGAAAGRVEPRTRKRVLVVEDHADARETLRMMLELSGHEVHEAEDGLQGLEVWRRTQPDVAFVDISMPGIDGFEFARRVRGDPNGLDVTLVALTGYGFPEDRERSRQAGFDHHLVKPVARKALDDILSAASTRPSSPLA